MRNNLLESEHKICTLIRNLEELPVFSMSLGSHELFHSNMWSWIINTCDKDINYSFLKLFFPEICINAELTAKRECKNRDIVVQANGKDYVIENKFKSIPTKEQLKNYSSSNDFAEGVLTGLVEPMFSLPANWHFISYKTIAKHLINIFKNKEGFNMQLILQYAESLLLEESIISQYSKSGMTEHWSIEDYSTPEFQEIERIRLGDICKKQKACSLEKYLLENIPKEYKNSEKLNGFTFGVSSAFFCKHPVVDIRYTKTIVEHVDEMKTPIKLSLMIGLQIQGNQYRRCAQRNNGYI